MVSYTFEATDALGVIISNSDYSKTEYDDLKEVIDNHATMLELFKTLRIEDVI